MDGGQQFDELPQADLLAVKGDVDLFPDEADTGMADAGVEFLEVFQQPNTGGAMDHGNVKADLGGIPFGEEEQLGLYLFGVEEFVAVAEFGGFHPDAGSFLEVIIGVELVFMEHLVHRPASVTAKFKAVADHRRFPAVGSAVNTFVSLVGSMV